MDANFRWTRTPIRGKNAINVDTRHKSVCFYDAPGEKVLRYKGLNAKGDRL